MAKKGQAIIMIPQSDYQAARAMMPRGIAVLEAVPHGGAYKVTIEGEQIIDGGVYSMVIIDHPLSRISELKPSETPEDA